MMFRHLAASLSLLFATAAPAQTPAPADTLAADTLRRKQLEEVVVEASRIVNKADRDLYFPSAQAVALSKDALQLTQYLMIPSLYVDDISEAITAAGQPVQVRINGRVATARELKTLLPQAVRRVDWVATPGLRYRGAEAVLNFIVQNPNAGGSAMLASMQGLNTAWGSHSGSLKLNSGRSEWATSGFLRVSNHISAHRNYRETFVYPDGHRLDRTETPLPDGYMNNTFGTLTGSYSYAVPDRTTLWAGVTAGRTFSRMSMMRSRLALSDGTPDLRLGEHRDTRDHTTTARLYAEQRLGAGQLLVADATAVFYRGHTGRDYTEDLFDDGTPHTDVHTAIHDRNQAYGLTANYIREWQRATLTTGVEYTANRNASTYANLDGAVFHQRQDQVYLFAEYLRRMGRVSVSAGMGATYTSTWLRETARGSSDWSARPKLTLTYQPADAHTLRLNLTTWQTAPTLAQTNTTPQQIDALQWQVGNATLHTTTAYRLDLTYNFATRAPRGQQPRLSGQLGARAFTNPDAIAANTFWQDGRLVSSFENSRSRRALSFWVSPMLRVVPEWALLSLNVKWGMARTRGAAPADGTPAYDHSLHMWSGDAHLVVYHWGWTLSAKYQRAARELAGERIEWGEETSMLLLRRQVKAWGFSAGMLMPFNRYDQGRRQLNRFYTNESHGRLGLTAMPLIEISYAPQWGRQRQSTWQRVRSAASTQQSQAAGR